MIVVIIFSFNFYNLTLSFTVFSFIYFFLSFCISYFSSSSFFKWKTKYKLRTRFFLSSSFFFFDFSYCCVYFACCLILNDFGLKWFFFSVVCSAYNMWLYILHERTSIWLLKWNSFVTFLKTKNKKIIKARKTLFSEMWNANTHMLRTTNVTHCKVKLTGWHVINVLYSMNEKSWERKHSTKPDFVAFFFIIWWKSKSSELRKS